MKIRLSEIFTSVQSEGRFTGMPTIFVKFFGGNLKCDGFGQKCPTDPSTYLLTYNESGVVDEILRIGREDLGLRLVEGEYHIDSWKHIQTRMPAQICFTGGEPMMQQKAIIAILSELERRSLNPIQVTIETNATKEIIQPFDANLYTKHIHMSCSPKLFSVSGEEDAIDLGALSSYINYADSGAIKFVHNGSQEAWDEIDFYIYALRSLIQGQPWQLWITPVGSVLESQSPDFLSQIVTESLKRGFWISHRVHIPIFGNHAST